MSGNSVSEREPLDGTWTIALDPFDQGRDERWFQRVPDLELRQASVPGTIQQIFPSEYGLAWYWRSFQRAAPIAAGKRALLRFHAVEYQAEVWLNGHYLGGHEGGETPFTLDATAALRTGENLLAVRVLNATNTPIDGIVLNEIPHRNKMLMQDFRPGNGLNYGGIVQPVELLAVPALRVTDIFARPDSTSGRMEMTVSLRNDTEVARAVQLSVHVAPSAAGETLASESCMLIVPPGDTSSDLAVVVPHFRLWSLEDPYLYRVTARLEPGESDGAIIDHQLAVRCGFRDFRVVDGYFRLNGKRLFLRSTHTGNHFPIGAIVPDDPDLLRRDLLLAKATGLNMVRFIAGMPLPEQLDYCDEIGLLVYEENLSAWKLADSPHLADRFDRSLREMILRDRNHPSLVVWGLLNETPDGPTFRHAVSSLALLRVLDRTRTVLLSSGRWDRDSTLGSVSNPGSTDWEYVWGSEGAATPRSRDKGTRLPADEGQPAYVSGAGDAHVYPRVPHSDETIAFLRTLGAGTKPVYLSEYGIGSLLDVDHIVKRYQQSRTAPSADDLRIFQQMLEPLQADWFRYDLAKVYPFPRDLLQESQRLHARWRLDGLNIIRSNPMLAGYNVTGMLDHGYSGEGLWTLWREVKPGIVDALQDGFAPLRWCMFVPRHFYSGHEVPLEVLLANEDVLTAGEYPAHIRIVGPAGPVWDQTVPARIPLTEPEGEGPLVVPVFSGAVQVAGPAGTYVLGASLEQGGSPAGGQTRFYLSDPKALPVVLEKVVLWGVDGGVTSWLTAQGVRCQPLQAAAGTKREVILVGDLDGVQTSSDDWVRLAARLAQGSVAVFLSPHAFKRGDDRLGWLPLKTRGRCYEFSNWLYHREDIALPHPIFAGLQPAGIMDWDYYGPVIPLQVFEGQETPDDLAAVYLTTGYASMTEVVKSGYASGLICGSYPFGHGRFLINSMRILEHLGAHPAADRLLLNMINYAASLAEGAQAVLPDDFEARLQAIGYQEHSSG